MLTTGVVMPLGAEQTNVLQATSVASDVKGTSFAKSFGEVAASSGGFVGATPAGQMLNGKVAPIAKEGDAPAGSTGSMDKLLNVSAGEGLKGASTPTNTALAKSGDAGVAGAKSVSAQSSERLENVPQAVSVVEGTTATGNASLQNAAMDRSGRATTVIVEKPIGPIGEDAGTKIDSVPLPVISKVVQSIVAGDQGQSAVQKKEAVAVTAGKSSGAEKATKKELKDKGHSSAVEVDAKNTSMPVEGPGTQVTMTVPAGAVTSAVAKTQAIDTAAEADSNAGAASGQVIGIAGAKASKSRPYGADRGVAGKSASGVSKDGTGSAAKADDGVARTKKGETDSSKTVAGIVSANGLIEGKTHGSAGVVAASAANSVFSPWQEMSPEMLLLPRQV